MDVRWVVVMFTYEIFQRSDQGISVFAMILRPSNLLPCLLFLILQRVNTFQPSLFVKYNLNKINKINKRALAVRRRTLFSSSSSSSSTTILFSSSSPPPSTCPMSFVSSISINMDLVAALQAVTKDCLDQLPEGVEEVTLGIVSLR